MPKPDLQKEILQKVKPGTKPSHLKKLKRSKSEGDIPVAPPLQSTPLSRSKSTEPFTDPKYPYTTLISQQQELATLQKESETKSTTISLLRKKIEELEAQLRANPPNALLTDQLTEKQKQIELLRQQLEEKPTETSLELDQSLIARHQSLKDWFTQFKKNQQLDKELEENIDEASTELLEQDKVIEKLRGQVTKLQQTNQSLQKDLDLSQRLAESRKNPLPNPNSNYSHLLTWAFLALWFISLLNSAWNASSVKNSRFKDN